MMNFNDCFLSMPSDKLLPGRIRSCKEILHMQPSLTAWCILLPASTGATAVPATQDSGVEPSAGRANCGVVSRSVHTGIRDFGEFVTKDDLRFEMASAELTPCARRSLDELIDYLARHFHQAVLWRPALARPYFGP